MTTLNGSVHSNGCSPARGGHRGAAAEWEERQSLRRLRAGFTLLIVASFVGIAAGVLFGFGVLVGQTWARVIGIALAVISAIINLAFLAAYPVWGVILIALDVVIIYALAMHGREVQEI